MNKLKIKTILFFMIPMFVSILYSIDYVDGEEPRKRNPRSKNSVGSQLAERLKAQAEQSKVKSTE